MARLSSAAARGQLVRLADVATIELGARSYSSGAQLNGKSVGLSGDLSDAHRQRPAGRQRSARGA